MKKSFLFVSCEEAQHICDKSQYDEASVLEKLKLNLRLTWCKVTRAYFKRNTKLTAAMKKADVDCLKEVERKQMQSEFEKELTKYQQ